MDGTAEELKEHLANDEHSYRKYGAKGPTQTRQSTRHYFKCNHEGCPARKVIEIPHDAGAQTKVEMLGEHNHEPDPHIKIFKRKVKDTNASATQAGDLPSVQIHRRAITPTSIPEQTKSKRASAQGVTHLVQLVKGGHGPNAHQAESLDVKPSSASPVKAKTKLATAGSSTHAKSAKPRSLGAQPSAAPFGTQAVADSIHLPEGAIGNDIHRHGSGDLTRAAKRVKHEDIMPSDSMGGVGHAHASANGNALEAADAEFDMDIKMVAGHEGVRLADSRITLQEYQPNGSMALIFDGHEKEYHDDYAWRKYGKKEIKGCSSSCPRFYWRCTNKACDIKRHTQARLDGRTEVHYYGGHTHLPPPMKGNRRQEPAIPASATPAHRDAHRPSWAEPSALFEDEGPRDYRARPWGIAYDRANPQPQSGRGRDWETGASPDRADSYQSQESGHLTDVSSIGARGLALPGSSQPGPSHIRSRPSITQPESPGHRNTRCPLFFLACVAAKEPLV